MKLYVQAARRKSYETIEDWYYSPDGDRELYEYSEEMEKALQKAFPNCTIDEDTSVQGFQGGDTWMIDDPDRGSFDYTFDFNDMLYDVANMGPKQVAKKNSKIVIDHIKPQLYSNRNLDDYSEWLDSDESESAYEKFADVFWEMMDEKSNYKVTDGMVNDIENDKLHIDITYEDGDEIHIDYDAKDLFLLGARKAAQECVKIANSKKK